MTREEAIKVFNKPAKHIGLYNGELTYSAELVKAFEMAINALWTEPCEDAISRQAVLDYIDKMPSELNQYGHRMIRRIRLIEYISDSMPSVNPQKVGRWIHHGDYDAMECSVCGEGFHYELDAKFCPSCGAKMDGGAENG